jgi:hypothetical protein
LKIKANGRVGRILNDYCDVYENLSAMAARNDSSSTHILMIILMIITFPIWFAVGAALFGLVAGIFGAMLGVFGAIFGGLMALIALPFKILFGWHNGWHWFPHFHFNAFVMIAAIIVVALIVKNRK